MVLFLVGSQARGADVPVGPLQPLTTLADALGVALPGDRLLVDPGTYAEPELDVGAGAVVEIVAAGGPGTVLLLGTSANVFDVHDGALLTLTDLEVDGEGDRRLASVRGGSTLAVVGCDVHDTDSGNPSREGGALLVEGSTLAITGSTFTTSSTRRRGGFLSLEASTAIVAATSFTGGHSDREGGAIAADLGSTLAIDGSTFSGNTSDAAGSAIVVAQATLAVTASTFSGNATDAAGTVRCDAAVACDLVDTLFDGNLAGDGGGAVSVRGGVAAVLRSTVCRSTGGSVVVFDGAVGSVTNTVLLSNALEAATILVDADADATIVNNTFAGNTSGGTGTAVRVLGTASFLNNLVAWSDGADPAVSASLAAVVTGGHQAYWTNQAADTDRPLPNDLVGVDPLVVRPLADSCDALALVPAAASPLVDAGSPTVLDADGSPSDIGAWGGQVAADLEDADLDGWYAGADCDDGDPAIHPGQPEGPCNGVDDDCDPRTLDDGDGDGDGVTSCGGDCDDTDPTRISTGPRFTDADADGFGIGSLFAACGEPPGTAAVGGDCDDADPTAFPGAVDVPYDAVDQDCDGTDLDDLDGDGALGADDCDDQDAARSPELEDVPDDRIDQDCTGSDASATLSGGAGAKCGCSTGAGGVAPALFGLLLLRRRRR